MRLELVEQYMYLVRAIAREICGRVRGYDVEDAVSDGSVALLDALRRFDPRYGVKFETYARRRIRGAIFDGIRRCRPESRRAYRGRGLVIAVISIDVSREDDPAGAALVGALAVQATAEASAIADELLARARGALSPVERLIVDLRFRDDMPLERISRQLGFGVSYVQYLLRTAVQRMRLACGVPEAEPPTKGRSGRIAA